MRLNDFMSENEHECEEDAGQAAADLAQEMIAFLSDEFHHAGKGERIELIAKYGPILKQLHKVKRSAKRKRGNLPHVLRDIERKNV